MEHVLPAGPAPAFAAEITSIQAFTPSKRLYRIQLSDPEARRSFSFRPGQFVMLELPGLGEAPFSISSPPGRGGNLELCIEAVGSLTRFLARVEAGTRVGISGPYGTHFPVEAMEGQDVLLIAGGLGMVPLRAPLAVILESRNRYGRVDLLYGSKDPASLLFAHQFEEWRSAGIDIALTVDRAATGWQGRTGLITALLAERLAGDTSLAAKGSAIVCGPPVMFRPVCAMLAEAGLPMERMFVSLERRMHCGRGKCCRCNIGATYTCQDGPVFDYWSVLNLKEAI